MPNILGNVRLVTSVRWWCRIVCFLLQGVLVAACGGGGSSNSPSPTVTAQAPTKGTFVLSGTISGLQNQGLILNNGRDDLVIQSNVGGFRFPIPLSAGTQYNITVKTQPDGEVCTVSNGRGTIVDRDPLGIVVICAAEAHTIGGTVSGLKGSGLVLQVNGQNNQAISGEAFTFSQPIPVKAPYKITVLTQPNNPPQTCSVGQATGEMGNQNVSNVQVTCADQAFTVSGTITGLAGSGLVLQNNGGNDLLVSSTQTEFTFETPVAGGASYSVSIQTEPAGPSQVCTVGNGSGTAISANIANISISCRDVVRFVYVFGSDGVFRTVQVNARTGESKIADQRTFPAAKAVAADDSGKFVYARTDSEFFGFLINSNTGVPDEPIPGGSATALGTAGLLAIDPQGGNLFDLPSNLMQITLYVIDSGDALGDHLSQSVSGTPNSIAFTKKGDFVFIGTKNDIIHSFSNTLSLVEVSGSPFDAGNLVESIAVSPLGNLLFAAGGPSDIEGFFIGGSGNLTSSARSSPAGDIPELAIDPSAVFAYGIDPSGSVVRKFLIDNNGGLILQAEGGADTPKGPVLISMDPRGEFLFVANNDTIAVYKIDSSNGALTEVQRVSASANLTYLKVVAR